MGYKILKNKVIQRCQRIVGLLQKESRNLYKRLGVDLSKR
jgi:hypothetical protein